MTPDELKLRDEIWAKVDRDIAASKARVNRNRAWYRLTSKCGTKCWDAMHGLIKSATTAQLMEMYKQIPHLDQHNVWWFTLKVLPSLESVLYHELTERGYRHDYIGYEPSPDRTWSKRPERTRRKKAANVTAPAAHG